MLQSRAADVHRRFNHSVADLAAARVGGSMRRQAMAMSLSLLVATGPLRAQGEATAGEARTAEQFIETAREAYSVRSRRAEPPPRPTSNEIVVQARRDISESQRLPSPIERAHAAGERPPDRIPSSPNVDGPGIFQGDGMSIGSAPEPIYIIDLAAIPEPLTEEEASRVFRAPDPVTLEAASPAAAP